MDKNRILDFPFFFLSLKKDIPFCSPSKWVSLSKIYPLFFLLSSSCCCCYCWWFFSLFSLYLLLHLGASLSPPLFFCSLNLNLIIMYSLMGEYFTLSKPLVEGCDCPLLSHSPISTLHSLSHPTINLPSRQHGTRIHRPMCTTNIIFYPYRHVWVVFCLPHMLPQFSNIIITFLPYYIRKK